MSGLITIQILLPLTSISPESIHSQTLTSPRISTFVHLSLHISESLPASYSLSKPHSACFNCPDFILYLLVYVSTHPSQYLHFHNFHLLNVRMLDYMYLQRRIQDFGKMDAQLRIKCILNINLINLTLKFLI